MNRTIAVVPVASGLILAVACTGRAQDARLPTQTDLAARARCVVKAVVDAAHAIARSDADGLLACLSHEDVVVRFGALDMASFLDVSGAMRRYAGLGWPPSSPSLAQKDARPILEREIKAYLSARPKPWISSEERRLKFVSKGRVIVNLLMKLRLANNVRQHPFFGDTCEQIATSLLCLEITRHAKKTGEFRSAATEATGVFRGKEYRAQLRASGLTMVPGSARPLDDSIDQLLDWHWDMVKYAYFHPVERMFHVDKEALEAGVASSEYREEHPWADDEGPNLVVPEVLAPPARVQYERRMRSGDTTTREAGVVPTDKETNAGPPAASRTEPVAVPPPSEDAVCAESGAAGAGAATKAQEPRSSGGGTWAYVVIGLAAGLAIGAVALALVRRRSMREDGDR